MADLPQAMELFVTGLRNQHAVETQAVQLLSRQVERLENYPEMEARMRRHIDESKAQAQRIEEILQASGASHSSIKDAGMGLVGNMAALAHAVAQDEVLKNTFANFAFEHFEIAAYRSLLSLTDVVGQDRAVTALQQSLKEEEEMAAFIDAHIGDTTMRYLERAAAGMTAGV
jgi:ferritin-like metal-binding protein YciE